MSKNNKTVLGVVIVLVVLGLIWWTYAAKVADAPLENTGQANTISSSSTTNADLNQDMTKVDAQMNALDSDSANADKSVNP